MSCIVDLPAVEPNRTYYLFTFNSILQFKFNLFSTNMNMSHISSTHSDLLRISEDASLPLHEAPRSEEISQRND